jgi:hypothetical protein
VVRPWLLRDAHHRSRPAPRWPGHGGGDRQTAP